MFRIRLQEYWQTAIKIITFLNRIQSNPNIFQLQSFVNDHKRHIQIIKIQITNHEIPSGHR